eukprot:4067997-Pyramimonas_sp.AAC.1
MKNIVSGSLSFLSMRPVLAILQSRLLTWPSSPCLVYDFAIPLAPPSPIQFPSIPNLLPPSWMG